MARVPRPPDLEPPTEQLKLVGNPRPQETDTRAYDVHLDLSRKLTAGEQDAAEHQRPYSPAGWVRVGHDAKHLVVADTTIEKVGEHRDSLVEIVAKIAAEGEEYRQRAVEARRVADEENSTREAERARRREAAKAIKFD